MAPKIQGEPLDRAVEAVFNATLRDVRSALEKIPVSSAGFAALISPEADKIAGRIEKAAHDLTAQRFGHTVNLYIPLYISNYCVNNCSYCWFGRGNSITRKTLSHDQVAREGARLLEDGYKSVLLVAGEDPKHISVSYISDCITQMKKLGFVFVGLEAQTMSVDQYRRLGEAGLDSVTVYQETYDREIYHRVHPTGPKHDYDRRLDTADRVAQAGIRNVGLGVLLGLGDFTRDALALASHVKYMQNRYWQTMVSVSVPRIHSWPGGGYMENRVSDTQLARLTMAMRLAFPDIILTLSTRESPGLRDRLFGVGINQVSAGSKTHPGGYTETSEDAAGEQFPVVDNRSPAEVTEAIRQKGLEWVWKDWDVNLKPVG